MGDVKNILSTTVNDAYFLQEKTQIPSQQSDLKQVTDPVFKVIGESKKRKEPDSENKETGSLSKKRKISSESEQVSGELAEITSCLNDWVKKGQPEEQRSEASTRIQNLLFSSSQKGHLSLLSLNLFDLPDIFGYQTSAQKIETLDLAYNPLTTLPKSIGNLTNLTEFNLYNNRLETLPESIWHLTNLEKLTVACNPLTVLSERIENLVQLKELSLYKTKLEVLPESIANLTELTELNLNDNQLKGLPQEIGNLDNLKQLSVYDNQLIALPESIGKLTQLESLHLENNRLTAFPESIGNLAKLNNLYLHGNLKFMELPETILNLPENCLVDFGYTELSEAARQHLQEVSVIEGYQGPAFHFVIREREQNDESLQGQVLNAFYKGISNLRSLFG